MKHKIVFVSLAFLLLSLSMSLAGVPIVQAATLSFLSAINYGAGANPHTVAMGDLNGDGKLDLGVANYGGGNVSVLFHYRTLFDLV